MARTLVLLPGLVCDETVWKHQIAAFGSALDCVVPDYAALDSLPAIAAKVLAGAPERFAVAGHSMGGRIALEMYRMAPVRITHIALLDTGCHALPAGETGAAEERGRRSLLAIARERGMCAMAAEWIPPMVHPDRRPDVELTESISRMMACRTADIFEAQMLALLGRPEAAGLLPQIGCPALVLTGREDTWSPPAQHAAMAAAISDSSLVIVPECGHMSPMERPEEVTAAMSVWLDRSIMNLGGSPHRFGGVPRQTHI